MKDVLFGIIGAIGAGIAYLFGGWSLGLVILLGLMVLDYVSGIIVAAVFKKSQKTPSGAMSSKVGFIGIAKKGFIIIIVAAACLLEKLTNTDTHYIRDIVVIFYACNETLSILENAGLMGMKIPKVLKKTIDVLQKEDQDDNELQHISGKTDN